MSRIKSYLDQCKLVEKGLAEKIIGHAQEYMKAAEEVDQHAKETFTKKRAGLDSMRMEVAEMSREIDEFRNANSDETQTTEGKEQSDPHVRNDGSKQ